MQSTTLPPCQNGHNFEDIFLSLIYLRYAVGIRGHKESGAVARLVQWPGQRTHESLTRLADKY